MKTLVLLLYWDRPIMVRNALTSLKEADSDNWDLAFLDDSSNWPGCCIAEQIFGTRFYKNRVRCYNTLMSNSDKIQSGGMMGRLMNQAIKESDAELAIMLCDDDAVRSDYFSNLGRWFKEHPKEMACYSHVHEFNPVFEDYHKVNNPYLGLNHTDRLKPWMRVDASQVAWRTSMNTEMDIWFEEKRTKHLDAKFYNSIGNKVGEIPFSGFVGQYKGCHATQLSHYQTDHLWTGQSIDTPAGEKATSIESLYPIIERYIDLGDREEAMRICNRAIQLDPADTKLYVLLQKASS